MEKSFIIILEFFVVFLLFAGICLLVGHDFYGSLSQPGIALLFIVYFVLFSVIALWIAPHEIPITVYCQSSYELSKSFRL